MSARPKFWKPGEEVPAVFTQERTSAEGVSEGAGTVLVHNQNSNWCIEKQRQSLPVFRYRNHILYLLDKYSTVVVVGETGSGKSTQIPQYLLESGWTSGGWTVAVTQPRRVAAVTVAARVALERSSILGDEVGYAIRFDDRWDAERTRLKFMTDGMLVREMTKDPLLSRYSVVMMDEAHERTLQTDVVIGLLKKIQRKRPDLRLIIASATLDADLFRRFFERNESGDSKQDTACVLSVEGRMYPVDVHYAEDPVPDYVKASVETVLSIHRHEQAGDVLVFLTGMDEVMAAVRALREEARKHSSGSLKLWILPMYGGLPHAEQMKVFARTAGNTRKVVVATNIAETSITIPGVVYVVDCGFVKLKTMNPTTGLESLVVVPTSKASAKQRAGRAGRVRSGKVYRLYTEDSWETLSEATIPEIQRSDLAPVVLLLKSLGIDNVLRFNFLSRPPAANLAHALDLLYALQAVDDDVTMTSDGDKMASLPLSPMFSKMILASGDMGCSEEVATIVAMMQIENVFTAPSNEKLKADRAKRKFSVSQGDHLTMFNVYSAFIENKQSRSWCNQLYLNYKGLMRATEIRQQLVRLMGKAGVAMVSTQDSETILRCITMGFFSNAALLHYSGVYKTIRHDHPLRIHPNSVLYRETPPQCVIFGEVVQGETDLMRDLTVIKQDWLYELAPHFYEFGTERERAIKRARMDGDG